MKKTTLLSLGVIGLSALTLSATKASADVKQPKAKTESTIIFKADDDTGGGPITPPGPGGDDKDKGIVDEKGSDGSKGDGSNSFNISWVTHFRFNSKDASGNFEPILLNGNGMTLWAKGSKLTLDLVDEDGKLTGQKEVYENIPNFVQVTDNRGTATGWNLTVARTDFTGKDAKGATQTLTGAELTLNNQNIYGPKGVTAPVIKNGHAVKIGAAQEKLMVATPGTGTGSWSLNFGDADATTNQLVEKTGIKLVIPASAQPKAKVQYKADLTWTLTDGPTA